MNPGGEPERDDTGLPPVDIEIPDDARELDRDVQAYYREQRAQRRQQRRLRLHGSLARDGIVLPLLACCLILALITGTLLTVFTATSDQNLSGLPGSGRPTAPATAKPGSGASAATGASATPGAQPTQSATPETVAGQPLPHATIAVDGRAPIAVRTLSRAALVLIPARCSCGAAVSWLIVVAAGAGAKTYLIYAPDTKAEVSQIYQRLGSGLRKQAVVAAEAGAVLAESVPAALPGGGPTAILIGLSHRATYATRLGVHDVPVTLIEALTH